MSHVVKTIKIKRGAKMHILANGAGRNLRSTIINHLNIRIMIRNFDCRGQRMMERYIADLQTIYSHVEFMSYNGKILTVAVLA